MKKLHFNCKCGKSLPATLEAGQTISVTCSCSLSYLATLTDNGTLIVCRDTVVNAPMGNAGQVDFAKGGHIVPLQNVPEYGEYVVQKRRFRNFLVQPELTAEQILQDQFVNTKIQFLEYEIKRAVKAERYEDAAKLRDRIKELENG